MDSMPLLGSSSSSSSSCYWVCSYGPSVPDWWVSTAAITAKTKWSLLAILSKGVYIDQQQHHSGFDCSSSITNGFAFYFLCSTNGFAFYFLGITNGLPSISYASPMDLPSPFQYATVDFKHLLPMWWRLMSTTALLINGSRSPFLFSDKEHTVDLGFLSLHPLCVGS